MAIRCHPPGALDHPSASYGSLRRTWLLRGFSRQADPAIEVTERATRAGLRILPPGIAERPQVAGVLPALRTPQTAVMDAIEQNKSTVTSFIDALFTKGDLGAVDEYLAEEFVNHDPPIGVTADREGMRAAGAMFRAAFPDWHSEMDILVGEGDLVVEHFTASGTQQGEIFGVPPSGRAVTLPGINIWRVRDGRIVERWGRLDELGLLRQLGLVNLP